MRRDPLPLTAHKPTGYSHHEREREQKAQDECKLHQVSVRARRGRLKRGSAAAYLPVTISSAFWNSLTEE